MTNIFISDLHLSEEQPAIAKGFLSFLDTGLEGASNLYILGDFFELWIGDDFRSSFHDEIIAALAAVKIPIFMMHGNRDFLLGTEFCASIGAELLPDPSIIKLDGEDVLLMHGDSLCTDDTQYMQVRGLLRSEAFQSDFLSKSVEERLAFAQSARQESQAHTSETEMSIMDVNFEEVVKVMEQASVRTLIHGHTHRPACHELQLNAGEGRRFVLGDWDAQSGWKITTNQGELELIRFEL